MLDLQSPHGELRTSFYNPHEVKRRRRTSRSQFKKLEKAFNENPKPDASTRRHLAQVLSMSPRGIQVWFQNRRAKSKQVNAAASALAENDKLNHNNSPDQQHTTMQTPDGVSFNGQSEPGRGSLEIDITTGTGINVFGPVHSSALPPLHSPSITALNHQEGAVSGTHVVPRQCTSQQGLEGNIHNISQSVQPTILAAHTGQHGSGPRHLQHIDHPIDGFQQPHHSILAVPPIFEAKVSPSNGIMILDQAGLQQQCMSRTTFRESASTGHQRPPMLGQTRRMSMPATIHRDDVPGVDMWNNQMIVATTSSAQTFQTFQTFAHAMSPHPFDAPASGPLPEAPLSSQTQQTNHPVGTTQKQPVGAIEANNRLRTYPLPRRVSIHETSIHLTQSGLRPKGLSELGSQAPHASGTETPEYAGTSHRRRRSSVGKVLSNSRLSTFSQCNASGLGTVGEVSINASAPSLPISTVPGIAAPHATMTTIPSGFTKAPAALKHLAGTGGPTLFNEKALDIWIGSNAFNQPLIIDGNAFQSTDSRIDKTIVGDRSSPECGRSTSLERGSSASSDLGNNFSDTNRMPTVTSGTIPTSAPMEIKKSRRRSSSKSVKSKPYPSTQIVSDVHQTGMESSNQLLAQNGSGNVPHQHHVPAGNDRTLPRQWMDGSNPSMSSVKLAPQESTRVPCVATGSAVLVDPEPQPPHYRVQPPASHRTFDRVDMNEGGHMDTLHQKLPTENPNTPDAQHARSNSCPPGFIERFESSFRITTGMANFNDSQTSTSGGIAMFQLQQAQQQLQVLNNHHGTGRPESTQVLPLYPQEQQPNHQRPLIQGAQVHFFSEPQCMETIMDAMPTVDPHTSANIWSGQHPSGPTVSDSHLALHQNQNQSLESPVPSGTNIIPSEGGHRHSVSHQHHLPQLQTPRMLAQMQHQTGHNSWSRGVSGNESGSRPSLPASFQNQSTGRRYSEPNMNDLTGAIIQSSSHQDVPYSTSQPAPVHTQQQCSSRQQQHALQFMAGSVQTGEMVLDMNSAESSIASSMHPFEMSLPGLEQDSLPTTPGISHGLITTTPIMSQSTCGPSSDGSYRGIPMAFGSQLASQRSSISPSPSPSPSPLASNNSCDHPRHLVSSDSNSSLLDSQPPPHAPLSVTPVAVGHTVGAPVLVRAHSLDSSAWQHPPPEDLNRFTDTNALVPIRRHSEGVPSASPTPMLLSQSQHTIVHQHQQQHHNSQHNQQQWERAQIKPSRNLNHFGYPLIQPFTPCDPNPFPLQIQAGHAPINNPCEPIHFQQPLAYTSHPMVPQPPPPFSLHTFLPDQTTQKPLISSLPNSPGLVRAAYSESVQHRQQHPQLQQSFDQGLQHQFQQAQPTSSHAFASFPPTPFGAPTLKAAKGTDEDKRYM